MIKDIHQFTIYEKTDGKYFLYNQNKNTYREISKELANEIFNILNKDDETINSSSDI